MKALIRSVIFNRWLRFCDKIMGSSEYSFGNIFLSYKDGLVIRATDGCLTAWMKIAECEPFYGEVQIPLRLLKGFLIGEKTEEVELTFIGDQVLLHANQETLRIKTSQPKDRERMEHFKEVGRTHLKKFVTYLDFATAALEEGDMTYIGSFDNHLVMVASSRTILSICEFDDSSFEEFHFSVPYMSSRHIVKAMKVYQKDCLLTLAIGDEKLTLLTDDFGMQICGEKSSFDSKIDQVFFENGNPEMLYSAFAKYISKAAWLLPKDTILKISGTDKEIKFFGTYGSVQYKAELPMGVSKPFEVEVSPHRLRSALARMSSRLFLIVSDRFIRIGDQKGRYVVIPFAHIR